MLVTKDSGPAGGTAEKLEAARAEGGQVIVVERPRCDDANEGRTSFTDINALVEELEVRMKGDG